MSTVCNLHNKKRVYQRNGVQEYLVFQMCEKRLDWFVLRDSVYDTLSLDENGVFKSELFPGLWFDTITFWANDLAALLATLQAGIASPDHHAFAARLKEIKR